MYVKAEVDVYNYLMTEGSAVYCPSGFIHREDKNGKHMDGRWRADSDPCSHLEPVICAGSNKLALIIVQLMIIKLNVYNNVRRYSRLAASMRDTYKDHFPCSIGEVFLAILACLENINNSIYLLTSIIGTHVIFTISACYIIFSLTGTSNMISKLAHILYSIRNIYYTSNIIQN